MLKPDDKQKIRALYLDGHSTRSVAKTMNMSYSYVWRICKDIARDRQTATRMVAKVTSNSPRSARARARRLMAYHVGRKLEIYEEVHHKDGDCTNNNIDNLEIRDSTEHRKLHNPGNPTPRHLRSERRKYMEAYNKKNRKVEATCPTCGAKFTYDIYVPRLYQPYCSRKCCYA